MKKLMTGALALGLAASLTACSSSSDSTATPSAAPSSPTTSASPTSTETSTTPASPSTTATSPAATSSTPAATSSASTPPAAGNDQGTPETVMAVWLKALVAGKTADICRLTAVKDKPVTDIPNGQAQCAKSLAPLSGTLKSVGNVFDGLTIEGATIKGNKATFEKARTTPELAAQVVKKLSAVKIGSKWYVTNP